MTHVTGPAELARQATERVLAELSNAERGVVVDSPPGEGKSTLVVRAAAELAASGERVMIAGQTNEQVDDLADRIAAGHPYLSIGRLGAHGYALSERVARQCPGRHERRRPRRMPGSAGHLGQVGYRDRGHTLAVGDRG